MSSDTASNAGGAGPPMKTCRFCFEPIRLEAVKCRYCGSLVSDPDPSASAPDASPTGNGRNVIYVVDKGLIRFGKFAIGVLTILTIVGALLYGVDIKQLRSEVEEDSEVIATLREENKALSDDLQKTLAEARRVQTDIVAQAETARSNARRAEDALASIQETRRRAVTSYKQIVSLQDGSFAITRQTTVAAPVETAVDRGGKLWPNGTTLHVRFLGGDAAARKKVEGWAMAWTEYANIGFVFDDDPDAEVRISFDQNGGSWSYLGRDNVELQPDPGKPTMNLGWLDEANVLHQFGHVLGLPHEHQNPYEPVPWDVEAVYENFTGPPNNWNRSTIEHNILQPYRKAHFPIEKPFDPNSIMLYSFADDLTIGGFPLVAGNVLSDGDKAFIALLYPKSTPGADSQSAER